MTFEILTLVYFSCDHQILQILKIIKPKKYLLLLKPLKKGFSILFKWFFLFRLIAVTLTVAMERRLIWHEVVMSIWVSQSNWFVVSYLRDD